MPYIGTSPSNGVRRVHTYTATASQTTFTGASNEGVTLSYVDTNYIDVFQNGVLLGSADYTSTSGTSVVLAQGASADALLVVIVYDIFSVADTVSKTNGGTFDGNVTMAGTLAVTGNQTNSGSVTITGDLASSTSGTSNFRAGVNAGDAITSGGNYNTVVGDEAGTGITTADNNTAVGFEAGKAITTNGKNTYIGYQAGLANAGDQNVFIGHGAGNAITDGDKNTIIGKYNGNQDGYDLRTADNYIVLSDGDGNVRFLVDNNGRSRIQGTGSYNLGVFKTFASSDEDMIKFFRQSGGNDTSGTTCGQIITTSSNVTAYQTSSDYRLKENVNYDFDATSRLKQLKPARFNFKVTPDKTVDGFLAHEVESVVPNAVSGVKDAVDEEDEIIAQGIDHGVLVPLLTKALQEQQATIEALTARITALENA